MSRKKFKLSAGEIHPLVKDHGGCMATDRITVDGCRVRFCYRQTPDNEVDSGWRFMAGDESDEYMGTASNLGVYDVNTIANYDVDIIPLLKAPVGSAFERPVADQSFVQIFDFELPD